MDECKDVQYIHLIPVVKVLLHRIPNVPPDLFAQHSWQATVVLYIDWHQYYITFSITTEFAQPASPLPPRAAAISFLLRVTISFGGEEGCVLEKEAEWNRMAGMGGGVS